MTLGIFTAAAWCYFIVALSAIAWKARRDRQQLQAAIGNGIQVAPGTVRRDATGILVLNGALAMVLPGLIAAGFFSGTPQGVWSGWMAIVGIILAFAGGIMHTMKVEKSLQDAGYPEPA